MIITENVFGVAMLVMQQSFLRMEIKLIQKNSLCTVGNIIQFLKTTINVEKYEKPIFFIRLASASVLSSLCEWLFLFNLNRSNNNNQIMILSACL